MPISTRNGTPPVESAINGLEHCGLDKCPDSGIDGFKTSSSLSVLARNIQHLGKIVNKKQLATRFKKSA